MLGNLVVNFVVVVNDNTFFSINHPPILEAALRQLIKFSYKNLFGCSEMVDINDNLEENPTPQRAIDTNFK